MKYILLICTFFVVLTACHENPYADSEDHLATDRPQPKPKPSGPPTLKIDAPTMTEMTEGVPAEIGLGPNVSSGQPILSVQGLPTGAVYDAKRTVIDWTPPANSGVDPSNPKAGFRTYTSQVTLASSDLPNAAVQQKINIRVYHPSP